MNGPFTCMPPRKKQSSMKEQVSQWVGKACQEIPATLIVNSFKSCGTSNAFDGTQDEAVWEEDEREGSDRIERTRLNEL